MLDQESAEERKNRKIKKAMLRSMGAGGIGLGLILLKFFVAPFIGDNPEAKAAITNFGLCLIGASAFMVVLFIFKRDWVPKAFLALSWVVIPVIFAKLLAGAL